MRRILLFLIFCGCGVDTSSSNPTPPAVPPAPVPRCARMVAGGYFDDKLATPCTFGTLDSHRVCLPTNMSKTISGVCNPAGGPDRLWIDRAGCGGDGSSRYVLSGNTKSCGELKGPIEVVSLVPQPDQNVYLTDPQTKSCTLSGLMAKPSSPIVDRAPPPAPVYLYAQDLASQPCELQ